MQFFHTGAYVITFLSPSALGAPVMIPIPVLYVLHTDLMTLSWFVVVYIMQFDFPIHCDTFYDPIWVH